MKATDALLQEAVGQQAAGNLAAARELFGRVLKADPDQAAALYSLAAISLNQGQVAEAIAYAERCRQANPGAALSWFISGSALRAGGRSQDALTVLNHAVALDPNHVDSHLIRGVVLGDLRLYREALAAFDRVLALDPGNASARGNRDVLAGLVAPQAVSEGERVALALALQNGGRLAEAQALFQEILEANPNQFVAAYSMAVLQLNGGTAAEGLRYAERCLVVEPTAAPSWYIHGAALKALRRFPEAMESLDRALKIDPNHLDAYITRGHVHAELKQYAFSLIEFNNVLLRQPEHTQAINNTATLLSILNKHQESAQFYARLRTLQPDFDYVLGALSHARLHCCDWNGFEELREEILQAVRQKKRACRQLAFLALSDSSADQLECARVVSAHNYPRSALQLWQGERYAHERIRVGYVSPDFREHPVGHSFVGVLEAQDKSRFEICAFSLGVDDNSALRKRFLAVCDRFVDVRTKPSAEIARIIREHEIDVLVDLAGPTMDAQPDIFAFRPAPAQMLYLGYPGTSGADYMDYILADRTVIPEAHQQYYTEKVLYLPQCYMPTDPHLRIAERTPTRAEMQLPEEGFVFCSFNHDYKINPPVFDVWMRILNRVEGSVLWLMKLNPTAEENLRNEAIKRGVEPNRLIFATRVPDIADHLARYRLAGLFLDTTPYNAHTTAIDALRVGLPVLTVEGGSFQSRVATSALRTVGVPELAKRSLVEYEEFAVHMARHPKELAVLKERVARKVAESPLTDVAGFARGLEAALEEAHRSRR